MEISRRDGGVLSGQSESGAEFQILTLDCVESRTSHPTEQRLTLGCTSRCISLFSHIPTLERLLNVAKSNDVVVYVRSVLSSVMFVAPALCSRFGSVSSSVIQNDIK